LRAEVAALWIAVIGFIIAGLCAAAFAPSGPVKRGLIGAACVLTLICGLIAAVASRSGSSTPPTAQATQTSTAQATGTSTSWPAPAGAAATSSPPDTNPPTFKGSVRITTEGLNFAGTPHQSDAAFATIRYIPATKRFSTGNSQPAAIWESQHDPTYEQCEAQVKTQALSGEERSSIPYRPGLALCVHSFDGNMLGYIKITEPPSGQSAKAYVIDWNQQQ
jgi:hypothetical protein